MEHLNLPQTKLARPQPKPPERTQFRIPPTILRAPLQVKPCPHILVPLMAPNTGLKDIRPPQIEHLNTRLLPLSLQAPAPRIQRLNSSQQLVHRITRPDIISRTTTLTEDGEDVVSERSGGYWTLFSLFCTAVVLGS